MFSFSSFLDDIIYDKEFPEDRWALSLFNYRIMYMLSSRTYSLSTDGKSIINFSCPIYHPNGIHIFSENIILRQFLLHVFYSRR